MKISETFKQQVKMLKVQSINQFISKWLMNFRKMPLIQTNLRKLIDNFILHFILSNLFKILNHHKIKIRKWIVKNWYYRLLSLLTIFSFHSITIFNGGGKRIYFGESFLTRQTITYYYPGLIIIFFFPQPLKGRFNV